MYGIKIISKNSGAKPYSGFSHFAHQNAERRNPSLSQRHLNPQSHSFLTSAGPTESLTSLHISARFLGGNFGFGVTVQYIQKKKRPVQKGQPKKKTPTFSFIFPLYISYVIFNPVSNFFLGPVRILIFLSF